jgi:hypothetical protein
LALALALLIGKLFSGHSSRSKESSPSTVSPTVAELPAVPPQPVERPQTVERPRELKAPTIPSAEPPSSDSDSPPANDEPSDALLQRGVGYLTVHSSTPHASVYMMFTRLGPVEERLIIPCGKRFIGVGRPVRDRKEPVLLAPGKMIEIPCGGSLEVTMNPRMLR